MGDSQIKRQRLLLSLTALGTLMAAPGASALEFGSISVDSHLNQPLAAQLRLSSLSAGEQASLDVHIASSALFKRFGIERSSDVDNLNVTTRSGERDGQVVVDISTPRPVREPFVDFLLEASTNSGRGLREYTVLLNPTGATSTTQAAQNGSSSGDRDGAGSARAPAPASPAETTDQTASAAESHARVHAGDTLSGVAAATRPPGATTAQMMVALFEANPDAFSGGINHLRRGARLDMPPPRDVRAIDSDAARARLAEAGEGESPAQGPTTTSHATEDSAAGAPQASGDLPPVSLNERSTDKPDRQPAATPDTHAARSAQAAGVAGNPAFGHLSMPRTDIGLRQQTTASDANADPGADDSGDADQTPAASDTPARTADADPGETGAAADDGDGVSSSDSAAAAESSQPPPEDVTEGGDAGGWSPRNALLGGLVLLLGGLGLIAYRRRSYKSVPMDFDGIDPDDDETAEAVSSAAEKTPEPTPATTVTAAAHEPSPDADEAVVESPVVSAANERTGQVDKSAGGSASSKPTASDEPDTFVPAILRNQPARVGAESDAEDDGSRLQDAPDASMAPSDDNAQPGGADPDHATDTLAARTDDPHDQGRDDDWLDDVDESGRAPSDSAPQDIGQRTATRAPDLIDPRAFSLDDSPDPGPAQDSTSDPDSVQIRLDLARMYLDMEDPDMARELLEDVVANGTEAQTTEARPLLKQC